MSVRSSASRAERRADVPAELAWLAKLPGYRAEIKRRIDEAARARELRTRRVEASLARGFEPTNGTTARQPIDDRLIARGLRELFDGLHDDDVDNLGREVEGCG
jgi:hypothetical protein